MRETGGLRNVKDSFGIVLAKWEIATRLLTWCKAGDLLALWLLGELQFESNPLSPFFRSFFFFDRTMCASIHVRNFVPNMLHTSGWLTERRLVENAQVDRGLLPTIIVRRNRLRSRYLRARPLLERSISRWNRISVTRSNLARSISLRIVMIATPLGAREVRHVYVASVKITQKILGSTVLSSYLASLICAT